MPTDLSPEPVEAFPQVGLARKRLERTLPSGDLFDCSKAFDQTKSLLAQRPV